MDGLGNVGQNMLLVVGTAVAAAAWTVSAYFNDDLDDDFDDAEEGSRRSLSSITWKDESGGDLVQYMGEAGKGGQRREDVGGGEVGRGRAKGKTKGKGKGSKKKGGGGGAATTLSLKSRSRSKSGSVSNLASLSGGALGAASAATNAGTATGADTYTGKVLQGSNQGSLLPRNQHGMGADMVASPEWGFYVSITPDQAKYFASKSSTDDEDVEEER